MFPRPMAAVSVQLFVGYLIERVERVEFLRCQCWMHEQMPVCRIPFLAKGDHGVDRRPVDPSDASQSPFRLWYSICTGWLGPVDGLGEDVSPGHRWMTEKQRPVMLSLTNSKEGSESRICL